MHSICASVDGRQDLRTASAGRIYGRLFTEWGDAGLFGPIAAGWLFELAGDYRPALAATAASGAIAMLTGRSVRPRPAE